MLIRLADARGEFVQCPDSVKGRIRRSEASRLRTCRTWTSLVPTQVDEVERII
jgi:hypothetical protein